MEFFSHTDLRLDFRSDAICKYLFLICFYPFIPYMGLSTYELLKIPLPPHFNVAPMG